MHFLFPAAVHAPIGAVVGCDNQYIRSGGGGGGSNILSLPATVNTNRAKTICYGWFELRRYFRPPCTVQYSILKIYYYITPYKQLILGHGLYYPANWYMKYERKKGQSHDIGGPFDIWDFHQCLLKGDLPGRH